MDLDPERALGATFDIDDIGWIDFETRSWLDVRQAGTYRYACDDTTRAIILAWAIGDGEPQSWATTSLSRTLNWRDIPPELRHHHARVIAGEALWCAHNAAFDRAIWNFAAGDFPLMEPDYIIDTAVQAGVSGLPIKLEDAAKLAGGELKDTSGGELIALFSNAANSIDFSDAETWDKWVRFNRYAIGDVVAMRDLFRLTRQLPLAEWREYWAHERINARGICIDLPMVEAAARMAGEATRRAGRQLNEMTGGLITGVSQVPRILDVIWPLLGSDAREILVRSSGEIDEETGAYITEPKLSLDRRHLKPLMLYLDSKQMTEEEQLVRAILDVRYWGGSATPKKFAKMLLQHLDSVIRGQYVFSGAPQTGRSSSRGIQVHNLLRKGYEFEIEAIDALIAGATIDEFAIVGDDTDVSRKLSLLIRPSLVPSSSKRVFVGSDWSQIEARILPWLTLDPDADERLDLFRAVDKDPTIPDLYTVTAADISGIEIAEVDETIRQRGKVVELASGFGGGKHALQSMAANYDMWLDEEIAAAYIDRWRTTNAWAPRFWGYHNREGSGGLWGAICRALEAPGTAHAVGRVTYVFLAGYLSGSLLCQLPSGRWLTYRAVRWERVPVLDEITEEIVDYRTELRFGRGGDAYEKTRIKLWRGLACENVVQATAADVLRGTLRRLEEDVTLPMQARLHSHDEILTECDEDAAEYVTRLLRWQMRRGFDWSEGLPLFSEETVSRWYTKNAGSLGL